MPTLHEYLENRTAYPDSTTITLADGVETTLGDMRSGYMKDADYRKKTSDLADKRRAFDTERQEWEVARLDAEARLTELAKTLMTANPGMTRKDAEEELEDDPRAKKLNQKIAQLESKLGQYDDLIARHEQRLRGAEETYVADQHRRVIADLKSRDADLDVEELITYAKSHYIGRLDDAYKAMRHDTLVERAVKDATETARKEAYEKAKLELMQPVISPRRVVTSQLAENAPKSLDEAAEAAMQDPEILKIIAGG